MYAFITGIKNDRDKRESFIVSLIVHLLLLLLFILPFVKQYEFESKFHSIAVNFTTELEAPQYFEEVAVASASKNKTQVPKEAQKAAPVVSEVEEKKAPVTSTKEPQKTTKAAIVSESTQTLEEVNVVSENIEEEKVDPAPTNAELVEEKKKAFSNLFKQSTVHSNNADEGTSLEPSTADIGDLVTGSGNVEGGLSGRAIISAPSIHDKSNHQGIVKVEICVNAQGRVISSDFRQKGSTTTEQYLIKLAKESVFEYQFTASDTPQQCGLITIEFRNS